MINFNVLPANIPGYDWQNGNSKRIIRVLSICEVMDSLNLNLGYSKFNLGEGHTTYSVESQILLDYAARNNLTYYAAPREDFSDYAGIHKALIGFYDGVILEDLSQKKLKTVSNMKLEQKICSSFILCFNCE